MKKIKLFEPSVGKSEERIIKKVLHSGFWASGAGVGNVLKFENEFKQYIGSKSCVALSNGTAALHLALSLIDIKNKEVILPSLSFVSTAHSIIYNGGKPVFVDVNPVTLCIDPQEIKKHINNKTKLIIPVHFAGMSCELSEIMQIANENRIKIIEDAAHAAGTSYKNKKIGNHGAAVCFSFHPIKNLAMPTGGAITLNENSYKKFESLIKIRRWCGISNRKVATYDVSQIGWNYYMNEFSASIGLIQLKKLDELNSLRRNIAKKYANNITVSKKMPFNEDCSYHFYWIYVKNRDRFRKKLSDYGIETGIHYKPIHIMSMYKDRINLPITENVAEHIVSLPCHPNLSDADVEKIIQVTNRFV